MTDTTTLKPGIYALVPCHEEDFGKIVICTDPLSDCVDDDVTGNFVTIDTPTGTLSTAGCPDGTIVVRIGLSDEDAIEASSEPFSVQTPFGPLTLARHYSIMPVDEFTRNPHPDEQYATNWICFEITGDQELSVDGTAIRIGGMHVDPTILGDVQTSTHTLDGEPADWGEIVAQGRARDAVETVHVCEAGTKLNDILQEMTVDKDDGVLYILTFSQEQLAEIEWIGTDVANVIAAEMRDQLAHGRNHIVLRPAIR